MNTILRKKSNSYTLYQKSCQRNFDTSAGKTYEEWRRLVTRNPLTDRRGKNVDQN